MFCTNCGARLGDGAFCAYCGTDNSHNIEAGATNANAFPGGYSQPNESPQEDTRPQFGSGYYPPPPGNYPPSYYNPPNYYYPPQYPPQTEESDGVGCLLGGVSFCVPIAGLILFLVMRESKPKTARACGIGALINVILYAVMLFAMFASFGIFL